MKPQHPPGRDAPPMPHNYNNLPPARYPPNGYKPGYPPMRHPALYPRGMFPPGMFHDRFSIPSLLGLNAHHHARPPPRSLDYLHPFHQPRAYHPHDRRSPTQAHGANSPQVLYGGNRPSSHGPRDPGSSQFERKVNYENKSGARGGSPQARSSTPSDTPPPRPVSNDVPSPARPSSTSTDSRPSSECGKPASKSSELNMKGSVSFPGKASPMHKGGKSPGHKVSPLPKGAKSPSTSKGSPASSHNRGSPLPIIKNATITSSSVTSSSEGRSPLRLTIHTETISPSKDKSSSTSTEKINYGQTVPPKSSAVAVKMSDSSVVPSRIYPNVIKISTITPYGSKSSGSVLPLKKRICTAFAMEQDSSSTSGSKTGSVDFNHLDGKRLHVLTDISAKAASVTGAVDPHFRVIIPAPPPHVTPDTEESSKSKTGAAKPAILPAESLAATRKRRSHTQKDSPPAPKKAKQNQSAKNSKKDEPLVSPRMSSRIRSRQSDAKEEDSELKNSDNKSASCASKSRGRTKNKETDEIDEEIVSPKKSKKNEVLLSPKTAKGNDKGGTPSKGKRPASKSRKTLPNAEEENITKTEDDESNKKNNKSSPKDDKVIKKVTSRSKPGKGDKKPEQASAKIKSEKNGAKHKTAIIEDTASQNSLTKQSDAVLGKGVVTIAPQSNEEIFVVKQTSVRVNRVTCSNLPGSLIDRISTSLMQKHAMPITGPTDLKTLAQSSIASAPVPVSGQSIVPSGPMTRRTRSKRLESLQKATPTLTAMLSTGSLKNKTLEMRVPLPLPQIPLAIPRLPTETLAKPDSPVDRTVRVNGLPCIMNTSNSDDTIENVHPLKTPENKGKKGKRRLSGPKSARKKALATTQTQEEISVDVGDGAIKDVTVDICRLSPQALHGKKTTSASELEKITCPGTHTPPKGDKFSPSPKADKLSPSPKADKLSPSPRGDKLCPSHKMNRLSSSPKTEKPSAAAKGDKVGTSPKSTSPRTPGSVKVSPRRRSSRHDSSQDRCSESRSPRGGTDPRSPQLPFSPGQGQQRSGFLEDLLWQVQKGYFLRHGKEESPVTIDEAALVTQALSKDVSVNGSQQDFMSQKTVTQSPVDHVSVSGESEDNRKPYSVQVEEISDEEGGNALSNNSGAKFKQQSKSPKKEIKEECDCSDEEHDNTQMESTVLSREKGVANVPDMKSESLTEVVVQKPTKVVSREPNMAIESNKVAEDGPTDRADTESTDAADNKPKEPSVSGSVEATVNSEPAKKGSLKTVIRLPKPPPEKPKKGRRKSRKSKKENIVTDISDIVKVGTLVENECLDTGKDSGIESSGIPDQLKEPSSDIKTPEVSLPSAKEPSLDTYQNINLQSLETPSKDLLLEDKNSYCSRSSRAAKRKAISNITRASSRDSSVVDSPIAESVNQSYDKESPPAKKRRSRPSRSLNTIAVTPVVEPQKPSVETENLPSVGDDTNSSAKAAPSLQTKTQNRKNKKSKLSDISAVETAVEQPVQIPNSAEPLSSDDDDIRTAPLLIDLGESEPENKSKVNNTTVSTPCTSPCDTPKKFFTSQTSRSRLSPHASGALHSPIYKTSLTPPYSIFPKAGNSAKSKLHTKFSKTMTQSPKTNDPKPSAMKRSLDIYDFDEEDDSPLVTKSDNISAVTNNKKGLAKSTKNDKGQPKIPATKKPRKKAKSPEPRPPSPVEVIIPPRPGSRFLRPRRQINYNENETDSRKRPATTSVTIENDNYSCKMEKSTKSLKLKLRRPSEDVSETSSTYYVDNESVNDNLDEQLDVPQPPIPKPRQRHISSPSHKMTVTSETVSVTTNEVTSYGEQGVPTKRAPTLPGTSYYGGPQPQGDSHEYCQGCRDGSCTTVTTRVKFRLVKIGQGLWKTVSITQDPVTGVTTEQSVQNSPADTPHESQEPSASASPHSSHSAESGSGSESDTNSTSSCSSTRSSRSTKSKKSTRSNSSHSSGSRSSSRSSSSNNDSDHEEMPELDDSGAYEGTQNESDSDLEKAPPVLQKTPNSPAVSDKRKKRISGASDRSPRRVLRSANNSASKSPVAYPAASKSPIEPQYSPISDCPPVLERSGSPVFQYSDISDPSPIKSPPLSSERKLRSSGRRNSGATDYLNTETDREEAMPNLLPPPSLENFSDIQETGRVTRSRANKSIETQDNSFKPEKTTRKDGEFAIPTPPPKYLPENVLEEAIQFDSEMSLSSCSTPSYPIVSPLTTTCNDKPKKGIGAGEMDFADSFLNGTRTLSSEIEEQIQNQQRVQLEMEQKKQQQLNESAVQPEIISPIGFQDMDYAYDFGFIPMAAKNGEVYGVLNPSEINAVYNGQVTDKGNDIPAGLETPNPRAPNKSTKKSFDGKKKSSRLSKVRKSLDQGNMRAPPPESMPVQADNAMDRLLSQEPIGFGLLEDFEDAAFSTNANAAGMDDLFGSSFIDQISNVQGTDFNFVSNDGRTFPAGSSSKDTVLECVDVMQESKVVVHRPGGMTPRMTPRHVGDGSRLGHGHHDVSMGPASVGIHTCDCGAHFTDQWAYQEHEVFCSGPRMFNYGL